ncbi:MAG: tetratricopeptide repeat protein [Chloroflexota bacterium]
MNRWVKRFLLLGILKLTVTGILVTTGGMAFFGGGGLPPADPAAAAAAPANNSTQPTPVPRTEEQSRQMERYQELQQRLGENPRDAAALAEMVDFLFQAKRYGPAADLIHKALEAGAESPRLRMGLGLALFQQGMPSMAQKELKRSIDADPNNAQAHFYYAMTMAHGSEANIQAARESWEAVVRLDGDGDLGRRARELLGQPAAPR